MHTAEFRSFARSFPGAFGERMPFEPSPNGKADHEEPSQSREISAVAVATSKPLLDARQVRCTKP